MIIISAHQAGKVRLAKALSRDSSAYNGTGQHAIDRGRVRRLGKALLSEDKASLFANMTRQEAKERSREKRRAKTSRVK